MQRLALIVREDAYDRVLTPLAFAWLAASAGTEVDVLRMNWAAPLVRPGVAERLAVSPGHAAEQERLRAQLPASVAGVIGATPSRYESAAKADLTMTF